MGGTDIAAENPGEVKRPGRRRLRISIGVLCLLIAGLAVGLARVTNEARRQRRAIEAIKRLGGYYKFDYEFVVGNPNGTRLPSAKPPGPDWLRRWIGEEPFRDVVLVQLAGKTYRDDDLALLEDLPRLREATIATPNITSSGLVHLRGQRRLRILYLFVGEKLDDSAMANLRDLEGLECLMLTRSAVGDSGVDHILGLKALRVIGLDESRITDVGLAKLGVLPKLGTLYVNKTPTSKAGFAALAKALPKIKISGDPRIPEPRELR